jgi:membrane-associated protease RseP (regulator of RpoE activity)
VTSADEIWLPLVDEPIGDIVGQIEREHPDVAALVATPGRILAFRTFAYIRVGLLLGQLLVDEDVAPYDGSETWVETLLRNPAHRDAIVREVRLVAEEIAADPAYPAGDDRLGPDDEERARFRQFARERLEST